MLGRMSHHRRARAQFTLAAFGAALLVWFAASFAVGGMIVGSEPSARVGLYAGDGLLRLVIQDPSFPDQRAADALRRNREPSWRRPTSTYMGWGGATRGGLARVINIPLWLPALLCLAWPVTSFLLARRRRRRGFPVSLLPPGVTPGPRRIGVVTSVTTGASGVSHSARVLGSTSAAAIERLLQARGVPARTVAAGRDKWIILFPESRSAADAEADRHRYQALLDLCAVDANYEQAGTPPTR